MPYAGRVGTDDRRDGDAHGTERRTALERVLFGLVREPLFIPVTFVIAAHLALALATVLVYVLQHGTYVLVVVLIAAALGSAKLIHVELRDAGRPGGVLGWVIFTWAAAGATAWGLSDWL